MTRGTIAPASRTARAHPWWGTRSSRGRGGPPGQTTRSRSTFPAPRCRAQRSSRSCIAARPRPCRKTPRHMGATSPRASLEGTSSQRRKGSAWRSWTPRRRNNRVRRARCTRASRARGPRRTSPGDMAGTAASWTRRGSSNQPRRARSRRSCWRRCHRNGRPGKGRRCCSLTLQGTSTLVSTRRCTRAKRGPASRRSGPRGRASAAPTWTCSRMERGRVCRFSTPAAIRRHALHGRHEPPRRAVQQCTTTNTATTPTTHTTTTRSYRHHHHQYSKSNQIKTQTQTQRIFTYYSILSPGQYTRQTVRPHTRMIQTIATKRALLMIN
jgi:hypothetical protein